MTRNELKKCCQTDIFDCDTGKLVNLKCVEITNGTPLPHRMEQYLEQIQNPYLFRVDQMTVKISFGGERDLTAALSAVLSQENTIRRTP